MKKNLMAVAMAVAGLATAGSATAASFANGGFESNSFAGWSQGAGYWEAGLGWSGSANAYQYDGGALPLNAAPFAPSGANYDPTAQASAVVGVGVDPITGQSTVRYGSYSARINNAFNNYSVNTISQTVLNYSGTSINFAWAAVLEGSHDTNDSDHFGLSVRDLTTNTTLYSVAYSSASTPGTFNNTFGWFWNNWTDVSLNVTAGHDFEISLLASDCPYGGHSGYVYLDGFGTVQGGPGDGNVPEPGSLLLAGAGLMAAFATRRRRQS